MSKKLSMGAAQISEKVKKIKHKNTKTENEISKLV